MNKFKFFVLIIFILIGVFGVFSFENRNENLASPVLGLSKIRFADNVWSPKDSKIDFSQIFETSQITAQAAFFVDTQTAEVLYEKNAHMRLSPASLTKIMTVIIALENKGFDSVIEISKKASEMEPDKMLLIEGEKLTIEELLEGIFLVSANDGAEALAEKTTGRREEFINLMNYKAMQLGMKNSHFVNPTGLEEDPPQYSTAYDIVLMSKYAIDRWPKLLEITSQPHIFIPATSTHQDYDLYSGINLLTTYPGVIGFKTGFTPQASLTLVTLAKREGREVLGVLLGSSNRRDDARLLLNYSFSKLVK